MSDDEHEADDPSFVPQSHLAEVGRVANAWAALEFSVDQVTWKLAGVPDMFGACLTAQMQSMHPKFRALIALAEVRGFDNAIVSELKRFASKDLAPLQDRRNRVVHDTRMVRQEDGAISRLQITAQGPLVFGFHEESLADLRATRRKIEALIHRFLELRGRILKEFQKLPAIEALPLKAITRAGEE